MSHELYGDAVTSEGHESLSIEISTSAPSTTYQVGSEEAPEENTATTTEGTPEGNPEEKPQENPEGTQKTPEEQLSEDVANQKASEVELANKLKDSGLDADALFNEYIEKGDLSAETRQSLEEKGYSKTLVDSLIAGRQALENRFVSQVHSLVGGEEAFNTLLQFAQGNLSQQEMASFNKAVDSDDIGAIGLGLQAIQAKFNAKHGTKAAPVKGAATTAPAAQGYSDRSQMVAAMSDKRYGKDAKYTTEVQNRVIKSNF